jgi:hypothetical protein
LLLQLLTLLLLTGPSLQHGVRYWPGS